MPLRPIFPDSEILKKEVGQDIIPQWYRLVTTEFGLISLGRGLPDHAAHEPRAYLYWARPVLWNQS